MTIKHRLETKGDLPLPTWSLVLYWVCWIILVAIAAGIGIRALRG